MIESGRKNHDESRFNDNKKQKWKMRMLGRSESDRAWAGHENEERYSIVRNLLRFYY